MIRIPKAHKKKNKFNVKKSASNPLIPLIEKQNGQVKHLYTGYFKHGCVIIENEDDVQALWENGYYGDGSLSTYGLKNSRWKKNDHLKQETDNPSIVKEVLVLCLEEAMFLSYAFGALLLTDEDGKQLTIDDMWTAFTEINHQFPVQYTVYHHMRCKEWVIKQGTKFGADWILYPVGPPFYHSQFLLWVQCLWEDTLEEDLTLTSRVVDMINISAMERLCSHVTKNVLICQVIRPRDLTDDDLRSIECVKRFGIKETIIQRWTLNSDQNQKDLKSIEKKSAK